MHRKAVWSNATSEAVILWAGDSRGSDGEILLAAKAPKKDGKAYEYPVIGHLVGLEAKVRGDGQKLLAMAGY